jgi:DNA repair exonuclease SbcCD nuclease subunit
LGIAVQGQSSAHRAQLNNLALEYPAAVPGCVNIGLLHTCLSGRAGHEPYAPCELPTLLAKQYDYWALGHVHQREVVHERPWVVFPGNLQGRHMQETGPKGASLVHVEGTSICDVQHRELDVVRFWVCEHHARRDDGAESVLEAVFERLTSEASAVAPRLLACRIVVRGCCRAHRAFQLEPERFEAELRARAAELGDVWITDVHFRTKPEEGERTLSEVDAMSQLQARLTMLREKPEELMAYLPFFEELRTKLPAEVMSGEGSIKLHELDVYRDALEDVQAQLLVQLLEFGEAS